MQIDFDQRMYNLDGSEATTGGQRCPTCNGVVGGETEPLTLRIVASRALVQPDRQNDRGMGNAERALLALKIYDAEEPLDLESEQVSVIKKYIDVMYPPVTVAQANEMLEGRENPFAR